MASCPHCFNTIANEYPQLGGNYQVIHHTQLLARLVGDGKLTPVTAVQEKITYHDPCFLGRHNSRCSPRPGRSWKPSPGVQAQEMHRCKNRGFCCGAGGARMWMEERIGKRINTERIDEALGTGPDTISTACPYCLVMLGDAISAKQAAGEAKESLQVIDVAQLLARSVATPGPASGSARPATAAPRPGRLADHGDRPRGRRAGRTGGADRGGRRRDVTAHRRLSSGRGQPAGRGVQRRGVRRSDHGPRLRPAGHQPGTGLTSHVT